MHCTRALLAVTISRGTFLLCVVFNYTTINFFFFFVFFQRSGGDDNLVGCDKAPHSLVYSGLISTVFENVRPCPRPKRSAHYTHSPSSSTDSVPTFTAGTCALACRGHGRSKKQKNYILKHGLH